MNIETFYRKQLTAFYGLTADEEGYVSLDDGTGLTPFTIEGRRVVLPLKARLREGITDQQVAYHPLCESVPRSTSPVMKTITRLAGFTATVALTQLMTRLINVAVKATASKRPLKLSVEQTELLTAVGDMGASIIAEWDKVDIDPYEGTMTARWYLKKAGEWKGNRYTQVAVFSSDLYEALCESDCTLMKTKKNVAAVKGLLEWILPGIETPDNYSFGSSTHIATRYHALMCAFVQFAKVINRLNTLFSDVFLKVYGEEYSLDDDLIDVSWESELDNLRAYADLIPPHPGNISGEDFKMNLKAPAPEAAAPTAAKPAISSAAMEPPRPRNLKDFLNVTASQPMMPMQPPGWPSAPMGQPQQFVNAPPATPQYVTGADGHTYIQYPDGRVMPLGTLSMAQPQQQQPMMMSPGIYPQPMINNAMTPQGQVVQYVTGADGNTYACYPNGQMVQVQPMNAPRHDPGPVSYGNPMR